MKLNITDETQISLTEWIIHQVRQLIAIPSRHLVLYFPLEEKQYSIRVDTQDATPTISVPTARMFEALADPKLFNIKNTFYIGTSAGIFIDLLNRTYVWKPANLPYWTNALNPSDYLQAQPSDFFREFPPVSEDYYRFSLKRYFLERLRHTGVKADCFEKVVLHHAIPEPLTQHQAFVADMDMFLHYLDRIYITEKLPDVPYAQQKFWQAFPTKSYKYSFLWSYRYMTLLGEKQVLLYDFAEDKIHWINNLDVAVNFHHGWKEISLTGFKRILNL